MYQEGKRLPERGSDDQMAVRKGDWKLPRTKGGSFELYHFAEDVAETEDLFAGEVGRAQELHSIWEAWGDGKIAPSWCRNQEDDE